MEVGAQRYKSSGEAGVQEIFTFHQSARRCEFRLSAGRMRGKAGKYVFEEAGALGGPETHVLAVDDCLIDRKIIERLLKTDSVKGFNLFCCYLLACLVNQAWSAIST